MPHPPDDSLVIPAYRRILRAAERGTGTRLSADEVWAIATCDDAIAAAVRAADEEAAHG